MRPKVTQTLGYQLSTSILLDELFGEEYHALKQKADARPALVYIPHLIPPESETERQWDAYSAARREFRAAGRRHNQVVQLLQVANFAFLGKMLYHDHPTVRHCMETTRHLLREFFAQRVGRGLPVIALMLGGCVR